MAWLNLPWRQLTARFQPLLTQTGLRRPTLGRRPASLRPARWQADGWRPASQRPASQRPNRQNAIAIALFLVVTLLLGGGSPAIAGLTDDHYDGNIFALYAGNGSLIPPKVSLAQSIKSHKPALMVFYIDDSADCKQFSPVVSQLQAPYGRAVNFIPMMADAVSAQDTDSPLEAAYYFEGAVPQTLVFDSQGKVVFNQAGNVTYEAVDDVLREVFDLLPRSESPELKRRPINQVNVELVD